MQAVPLACRLFASHQAKHRVQLTGVRPDPAAHEQGLTPYRANGPGRSWAGVFLPGEQSPAPGKGAVKLALLRFSQDVSSETGAFGPTRFTAWIPFSIPCFELYISLLPMGSLLAALRTK